MHALHSDIPEEGRALVGLFLGETEQRAWMGLVETYDSIQRALEARLLAEHGLPLSSFEAMIRIAHSESSEISISDLAERVGLSPSRVSRLVIELEGLGFVERKKSETDSRSTRAAMTEKGFLKLHEVAPAYLSIIKTAFLDHLENKDIEQLAQTWEKLRGDTPA